MRATQRLLRSLSGSLFAGGCYLCRGSTGATGSVLCDACESDLPTLPAARCTRCALPCPAGVTACGRCLSTSPPFDASVAVFAYAFPADVLVPVPLSQARMRARGYNQALEIARGLSSAAARIDAQLIERTRDTPAQSDLPWAERARNIRGAFRCRGSLAGARVAVVDDVMTTGATLSEIATVLKNAGAAQVVNWVAVRTLPPAEL